VFYGAEGYYVGGRVGVGFGASGEYIDVRQCESSNDFAQERRFLLVGLDQGCVDKGGPHFYGEAGESGSGADVDEASGSRGGLGLEEVAGGEEGFAEVAGYDFFGLADGGEVDAGVPAEE